LRPVKAANPPDWPANPITVKTAQQSLKRSNSWRRPGDLV